MTTKPTIRVYEAGSAVFSVNPNACEDDGYCDLCGVCIHTNTTVKPNQCIGVDGIVYGQPDNECPVNEVYVLPSLKSRFVIRMDCVVHHWILIVKGLVMVPHWPVTVLVMDPISVVIVK